jgi:hypothetical protein
MKFELYKDMVLARDLPEERLKRGDIVKLGTERSGQEYLSPLLVLTGEEYTRMAFEQLHERICETLRGNRAPVLSEMFLLDGTHKIFRQKKPPGDSGIPPTDSPT